MSLETLKDGYQDFYNWQFWGVHWGQVIIRLVQSAITVVIVLLVANYIKTLLRRFLRSPKSVKENDRRLDTMRTLVLSLLQYAKYFVIVAILLNIWGLSEATKALFATAGIGGIAIAFGAQSLVKDIISGGFMLFENQFAVGDYIATGKVEGIVERVTMRVTHIRSVTGELHILPNGIIDQVTNYSRGNMLAMVDIPLSFQEDADRAIALMRDAATKALKDDPDVIEPPNVLGIVDISEAGVIIRTTCRAVGRQQYQVERRLRLCYKEVLDREGISIAPRYLAITDGGKKVP